jgi:threonine aldolase
MTHTLRGDEVLIPADNHIVLYEVGASAVLSGVAMRFLKKSSGIIDTGELQNLYRTYDIHHPRTGLICIENAHTQGTAIQVSNSKSVYEFADSKGVPVHLDGARIFNAAVALGTEAKNIAANADSVMFCFSKGLCAPVGSVLAGKREFIRQARKNRKLMGGGMRQVGYLAAACLVALEKMTTRLVDDHKNAKYLASCLQDTDIFEIDKKRLDINMVFAKFKNDKITVKNFNEDRFISFLLDNKIKINPMHDAEYRFVTHYYISRRNIDYFVEAITNYFNKEVF